MNNLGSLFSLMVLSHFVCDWLPQPESWAMVKHKNWAIRFMHSAVYAALMTIVFAALIDMHVLLAWIIFNVLWFAHFVEDTYWFPMWWLTNVRKTTKPPFEGLNLILLIVVDQLVHIAIVLLCCFIVLA